MKIWINTVTGDWGNPPEDLVVVDLKETSNILGVNTDDILTFLDNSSDEHIINFGKQYGLRVTEGNR